MEKIKYLKSLIAISFPVFLLTVFGCEKDLLDQVNPNQLSSTSFWKTADDAYKAVVGIYAIMPESGGAWGGDCAYNYFGRGDEVNPLPGDVFFNSYFVAPYSHWIVERPYNRHYRGIFRANLLLENVPNITMDETVKNNILGEAYFLRGFYYFVLLNYYHNISLITETPKTIDDYYPPQADPEAVWSQIESDFKQAQTMLPDSWDTKNIGRATWGAASGMLGKTYLYQKKWTEAAEEFKKVIDKNTYDLVPNYRDNFNALNENNIESLWEIQFYENGNFTGWFAESASTACASTFEATFCAPKPGAEGVMQVNKWVLDSFLASIDNDGNVDKRVFATLCWDHPESTVFEGKSFQTYFPLDDVNRTDKIIYCKKWVNYEGETEANIRNARYYGKTNLRLLRFADILLMYAEAVNESYGPIDEAYSALNRVRQRANVPDITLGLTKDQFRNVIKNERILELSLEGVRFYDLLRWGELEKAFLVDHPDCKSNTGATFTPNRDEYLPIPQQEIDGNRKGLINQNPGY